MLENDKFENGQPESIDVLNQEAAHQSAEIDGSVSLIIDKDTRIAPQAEAVIRALLKSSLERSTEAPKKLRATYSIREEIGSGSFAKVKRARHRVT